MWVQSYYFILDFQNLRFFYGTFFPLLILTNPTLGLDRFFIS